MLVVQIAGLCCVSRLVSDQGYKQQTAQRFMHDKMRHSGSIVQWAVMFS
jgi:hypothetical protein